MTLQPDFSKGLIPAIIQNEQDGRVLMLGYMDAQAFEKSRTEGRVCFFSRSKNRLWTKGESSGNFLNICSMQLDCDADALLIRVSPEGPTCHTGSSSCFGDELASTDFLQVLQALIAARKIQPKPGSYTNELFDAGIDRIAQKVGEEGVETVIAAKNNDLNALHEEAADLIYHLLVLLTAKKTDLNGVIAVLKNRHQIPG